MSGTEACTSRHTPTEGEPVHAHGTLRVGSHEWERGRINTDFENPGAVFILFKIERPEYWRHCVSLARRMLGLGIVSLPLRDSAIGHTRLGQSQILVFEPDRVR